VFDEIFFILAATLTIGCAFAVAFTKNLMHSCVYLLGCLFGVAGLYATLGADFLAATQIVVYAGGVVILMLFAIMLTGGSNNTPNKYGIRKIAAMGSTQTYVVAGISVLVISMTILKILGAVMKTHEQGELPAFESTVTKIGTLLITDHVLAFEISSVLLLGALVGAAVISRPKKNIVKD
jgi:NADH-quinone oxidoreductase subunit J